MSGRGLNLLENLRHQRAAEIEVRHNDRCRGHGVPRLHQERYEARQRRPARTTNSEQCRWLTFNKYDVAPLYY